MNRDRIIELNAEPIFNKEYSFRKKLERQKKKKKKRRLIDERRKKIQEEKRKIVQESNSRRKRHDFLLTLFDDNGGHYAEKEINGYWLVRCFNGNSKMWQVFIYTQDSFKRYKEYQERFLN